MTQPLIQLPPSWMDLLPPTSKQGVYASYLKNPGGYAVALNKVTGGIEPMTSADAQKVGALLVATTAVDGNADIARAAVDLSVAGRVINAELKQPKIAEYSLKGLAIASLEPRSVRSINVIQSISDGIAKSAAQGLIEVIRRRIYNEMWVALVRQFGISGWTQTLWDSFIGQAFRAEATRQLKGFLGMAADAGYKSPVLPIGTTVSGVSQFLAPWANNYAETVVDQFDQTNAQAVQESLSRYVDQGLSQAEMANRIRIGYGLDPKSIFALDAFRTQAMKDRSKQGGIVQRLVVSRANKLLENRVDLTSQTAVNTAMNYGRLLVFSDAIARGELPRDTKKVWVTALDERVCPICRPMDGVAIPMDEPFKVRTYSSAKKHHKISAILNDLVTVEIAVPPIHPQCLLPDSRVSASGITATSERWYDGEAIVVSTASGNNLSCTPNHPVLTDHGWIAAKDLVLGDNVISSLSSEWKISSDQNEDHMPPTVQEIAKAFRSSTQMSSAEVPVSTEDFHGDGMGSQVAVVRSNSFLRNHIEPSLGQHVVKQQLTRSNVGLGSLTSNGSATGLIERDFATFNSIMGGISESLPLIDGSLRHTGKHGIAAIADSDPGLLESSSDDWSADGQALSQRLLALTGEISTDEIINIDRNTFHGPVYNLETVPGWYISNGIVTHNCRCIIVLSQEFDQDLMRSWSQSD